MTRTIGACTLANLHLSEILSDAVAWSESERRKTLRTGIVRPTQRATNVKPREFLYRCHAVLRNNNNHEPKYVAIPDLVCVPMIESQN